MRVDSARSMLLEMMVLLSVAGYRVGCTSVRVCSKRKGSKRLQITRCTVQQPRFPNALHLHPTVQYVFIFSRTKLRPIRHRRSLLFISLLFHRRQA